MSIFISFSTQNQVFLYFHIMFAVAISLNIVSLVFLIKITPPKQAVVRNYLILIQALLILIDVNFDIGFCPIFLFPAPAGYALGVLMQIGLSAHLGFFLTLLFYVWMGAAITSCIIFRQQTLLPEGSSLKVEKKRLQFMQILLTLAVSIFYIIYAFNGNDSAALERILIEYPTNITWIRGRGSYYITQRTTTLTYGILAGLSIMAFSGSLIILMFASMLHELQKDKAKRSWQSRKIIRRSLSNLFCQLVVPLFFFGIPAGAILLGVAIENFLSFEVSFGLFFLLPWHSVWHNMILLSVTTVYRNRITSLVKKMLAFRPVGKVLPKVATSTLRIRQLS